MEENSAQFDPLPRKAESRLQMDGSSPETFVSILCMQNASLARTDKSLVLASAQGTLGTVAVAWQVRRLSWRAGGAVQRDVLASTEVEEESKDTSDDDDFVARAAFRVSTESMAEKEYRGEKK